MTGLMQLQRRINERFSMCAATLSLRTGGLLFCARDRRFAGKHSVATDLKIAS